MKLAIFAAAGLLAVPALAAAPAGPASTNPKTVQAGTYAVEPAHTRVQFTVSHMGFTEWYGDFTGASGSLTLDPAKPAASKLDISIPTASVSTTNAKLDGELRDPSWFDAARFPTITFRSTRVTPTGPREADVTGDFTLHGVTRPLTLHDARAIYEAAW